MQHNTKIYWLLLPFFQAKINIITDKSLASSFLSSKTRVKRSNNDLFEEWHAGDLERECFEEPCIFEEVKEAVKDINTAIMYWDKFTNLCVNGNQEEICDQENTDICVNKWQKLDCICKAGWTGSQCRDDIDECLLIQHQQSCLEIHENMECVNTPGAFQCSCQDGFLEEYSSNKRNCLDIDECAEGIAECEQNCMNYPGSFECSCGRGFRLDLEDNKSCLDIDECARDIDNICNENSDCENLNGDYRCICHSGYTHMDIHQANKKLCIDIDECQNPNNCASNGTCINHDGGYTCDCDRGYQNEGGVLNGECLDIDECTQNNGGCMHTCTNHPGGFNCGCYVGYELDSFDLFRCLDINECLENNGDCPEHSLCVNQQGSYSCICLEGFRLNEDDDLCYDINECEDSPFICPANLNCLNTIGSFKT